MRRKLLVMFIVATLGLLMLFAPVISSSSASYTGPSSTPPLNNWLLSDPSGTYTGSYLGNGTYSMNTTAYQKLLHDPYTVAPTSNVKVEGNMVYIFVPSSGPLHGTTTPLVLPSNELQSITSLLLGHGGILVDGNYLVH